MTNAELQVSYETVRHLDTWLMQNVANERQHPDTIAELRQRMLLLVAADEAYWTERGWWRVHDIAEYGNPTT